MGKKDLDFFFNCNDGCNFSSNKGCVWDLFRNSQKCKHIFFCKKKRITAKFGIGHNGKSTSLYWLITNRVMGDLVIV